MNLTTDVRRNPILMEPSNRGILRLDLVEKLPASEFGSIIGVIDNLYFAHLWLGAAQSAANARSVPEYYAPNEREKLYVKRLEIGTPNMMELIGLVQHVLPTFATVAGALGATKALAALIHEIASARQAFAGARKTDVETELLKLDLRTKTSELLSRGKITPQQAEHKMAIAEESEAFLHKVLPLYAHTPQFRLEYPPQVAVSNGMTTGPADTSRPQAPRHSRNTHGDAEARLRGLAGPSKQHLVRAFFQAYLTAAAGNDPISLVHLKTARRDLTNALGISEEHLDSILGGDIEMTY